MKTSERRSSSIESQWLLDRGFAQPIVSGMLFHFTPYTILIII